MRKSSKLNNTYRTISSKDFNSNPFDYYSYNYDIPSIEGTNNNTVNDTIDNTPKIPFLGGMLRYSKLGGVGIGNPNGTGTLNTVGNNLGRIAAGVNLATQGYNILNNLDNMNDAKDDASTLKAKILSTAAANPMNSSYLSADNMRLLRQLRNGTYEADDADTKEIILNGLSGALKGTLTGVAGGIPGMVIGGFGGAINDGMSTVSNAANVDNQKLEALLAELEDAQTQYNRMKRPNYSQMGLQSRYTNQWV